MLAAKHFDPVLGIDVHIELVPSPAGPIPTPLPHPFVGMVFDPLDYLPGLGATVLINGLPRAHAGSAVLAMPHVPIAGPFLKLPANSGQVYMGSSSVIVDGEPMSYAALPVLSCSDLGVPPPLRFGHRAAYKALSLPTSMVIPIAVGGIVLIGGAPTISVPGPELLTSPIATRLGKAMGKAKQLPGPLRHLLELRADTPKGTPGRADP